MPDMPTTKAGIDALPLPTKNAVDYRDPKQRNLILRISPAGTKSWSVRYDRDGKSTKISIGRFPELPISLARDKAASIISSIAAGNNPASDKKAGLAAADRRRHATVETIGRLYLEKAAIGKHRMNGKPMRENSKALETMYFENVLVPWLGAFALEDLTRASIQDVIDKVEVDMSPSAARHARNVLQKIYAFAGWQDIATTDPTRFVTAPGWTERERVLTDEEMKALWSGLNAVVGMKGVNVSPRMVIAIKLAAVTLQRRGEIVGMKLDEIDRKAKTWTLPGTRTKNGRTHVVPLSDLAMDLIDEATPMREHEGEGGFVFPSPRDPEKPVGAMALTHAWRRLLPHLSVPAPTTKNPDRKKLVTGITPHDLRRTGATAITSERIDMPRFTVSQVLNHTSDSGGAAAVTAVYDRNAYMKEKRAALNAWAALLQEIVEGMPRASNVVPLAR